MKLLKEIEEYCNLNNINDVEEFINECTRLGFLSIKYKRPGKQLKNDIDKQVDIPIIDNKKIKERYDIYGEDL